MLKDRRQRDTRPLSTDGLSGGGAGVGDLFRLPQKPSLTLLSLGRRASGDRNFWIGVIAIPIGWLLLYSLFDRYRDIYRISRLSAFFRTAILSLLGVTLLFFTLILDDVVYGYTTYYQSFVVLLGLHLGLTLTVRMIVLTWASRRLKAGIIGYTTLIIGGNERALELYRDVSSRRKSLGYMPAWLPQHQRQQRAAGRSSAPARQDRQPPRGDRSIRYRRSHRRHRGH